MLRSQSFQFHKGTIRTKLLNLVNKGFFHFNSIKVQLERNSDRFALIASAFQFHKGTIRTCYI